MKGRYSLSLGGLVGSFAAVCGITVGVPKLDLLLFSLLIVSISGFAAVITEDRRVGYANAGFRSQRSYQQMSFAQAFARICFGGALASALFCAVAQATVKLSSVFSISMVTAAALSIVLFFGYAAMVAMLLSLKNNQFAS